MEADRPAGEIMRDLQNNGLDKTTLAIFARDNGPWLNFGGPAGPTGELRERKATSREEEQRVPCIMKWPDIIPRMSFRNMSSVIIINRTALR